MSTPPLIPPGGFYRDPGFDFGARLALGAAAIGIADVGLVLATLDQITDGDVQGWFDSWTGAGSALASQGADALAAGHLRTAEWAYLGAAEFYGRAMDVVDALPDQTVLMPTFREHRRCWDASVEASDGRIARVLVPYENVSLPGYLLRPDSSGAPRPTVVLTNGSDSTLSGMIEYGGAEAVARGWNAFIYDGPGQQSMLFDHGVPFRPDWEAVLTPVLDTLSARSDVDAGALLGYGTSQAGYWLSRAIAFEHRLVAAVVDPGVVDVSTSWTLHIPPAMRQLLATGQKDAFNKMAAGLAQDPGFAALMAFRSRPFGLTDPFEVFAAAQRYHVREVAHLVITPLLITDPQDEQFWMGQSRQLFDLLPGSKKLLTLTRGQGANLHVEPMGRRLTNLQMFDWLADRLADAR